MSYQIAIDADRIATHAQSVEQIATDVRVAIQAAGQTMMSAGAFGLMCSWMVPPFLATTGSAVAAMTSTAGTLDRSARDLRAVARSFDEHETEVSAVLTRLRSSL